MLLHEAKMVVSSAKTIDFECFKQLGISLTVMALGPILAELHK